MRMQLKRKGAFVTGAGQGIGKAIAVDLASNGATVFVTDLDYKLAQETSALIETDSAYMQVDVANLDDVQRMIDTCLQKFSKLDILINNAGITDDNILVRMSENQWDNVINTNLKGAFNCIKNTIRYMMKNKYGRIVNITSIVGHTGNLGQSNYAASKSGIIGMSKSLAIEYAKKNITVNCVSPGFITSDMTLNIAEKVKLYLTSRIPMGKLGTGEDVSNCVAFLSSEQASYVTGETIHVNGGMYMS